MTRKLLSIAYAIIRLLRRIRLRLRMSTLRLRGVQVHSTARISSGAIFQPSGGTIIIGAHTYIDRGVILRALGGKIEIGEHCSVNAYSVLLGGGELRIGKNVRIAAHTVIVPSNHVFSDPDIPIKDQGLTQIGITIKDDVWIGAGVRVLDGVVLGRGCVVAAGAVVTRPVPPCSVVGGVPVRQISTR